MRRTFERLIPTLVATLLVALPAAAQQVTLERDSPLYAEPRLEAAQVTQLKQGANGEVIGKQGAWLNLKTAGGSGWLFSFNVRFQSQKAEGGDGGGSALGRVFGPRQNVNVTAAIGIRGLDEQDLKQASFSDAQMKLLDGYTASKQAAEDGARATGLAAEKVEYLGAKR
jgi:hypothetical protein